MLGIVQRQSQARSFQSRRRSSTPARSLKRRAPPAQPDLQHIPEKDWQMSFQLKEPPKSGDAPEKLVNARGNYVQRPESSKNKGKQYRRAKKRP